MGQAGDLTGAAGGSPEAVRTGAQLMFYGGDVIDLALAVVLLAGWYARGGRRLRHAAAVRSGPAASAHPGPAS